MRSITIFFFFAIMALCCAAGAQEKKNKGLQLKDLPAAVQKTVEATVKGGEIRNVAKEKEDGVEQYEIETTLNGKSRDFSIDSNGVLLEIEEATTIDAVPAAAQAGILKRVGNGKLRAVETFSRPGKAMLYEAAYTDARGKKHEFLVKPDGALTKE